MTKSALLAQLRGLYAITDTALVQQHDLLVMVESALRGGTRIIQYRDKVSSSTRRHDIAALATYFLARSEADYARPDLTLGEDALQALRRYDWPGNIRELKNAVDRLAIFAESTTITGTDVATALRETQRHDDDSDASDDNDDGELRGEVRRREMAVIVEALSRCNWNVSEAARQLGIARASLHRKIKEYGLEREPHGP